MSNAFAPIVRARPCPIFGRPVHLWVAPRLRPDTSPQTLRIPDRSGHPVLQTLSRLANEALPPSSDTVLLIRAPKGLQPSRFTRCPAHTISQYDFHSVVRPPSPCRLVGPYKLSFEPNGSPVFTLIPLVACWRYEPREHPRPLALLRGLRFRLPL